MNETAMNRNCMYEEVTEVRNLNRVEGFDPKQYMRVIQGEGETARYYLDVAFRKLWFRLKYPEGKIVKKILKLTDQIAIVEARVYLNRNDEEDNFISNALAQKYFSTADQFGSKYVELAETAAVGRALSDAGFGLQFADREGELDPQVTEAPFEGSMLFGEGSLPEGTYMEESAEDGEIISGSNMQEAAQTAQDNDEQLPGQQDIEDYLAVMNGSAGANTPALQQMTEGAGKGQTAIPGSGQNPALREQKGNAAGQMKQSGGSQSAGAQTKAGRPASSQQAGTANQASSQKAASGGQAGEIRKDMSVEQIYSLLSREKAAAVVVSAGYHKGKTLGQVSIEKPQSLQWYVDSYGGPDNLLRAAAKFLLDTALKQAG